ncbi:MAG: DUF58 domain-containing protein [Candidatus Hinthialibacter antarcticus]|nr:DUF58 domain-containing protein [Candidatus Hinthialibacter antarcticus]
MPGPILDAAVLSSISHLELHARQAVEGAVSGMHHSHLMGRNVEFSEHRPYNPGDELRHIDWRVFAKTDRFHVKQFEEDTNLRTQILIDLSGSMWFGDTTTKALYSQQMAAAFSYLILHQGDSVGLATFDQKISEYLPPRNRREQWSNILETLVKTEPNAHSSNISGALELMREFVKKRGIFILISDLIEDPERVLQALSVMQKMKQDVIVFHVLSPEELDLPYRGTVDFYGAEGEEDTLRTAPKKLRDGYRRRVESFIETYRNACLEMGADYQLTRTDRPLDQMLREYLQQRMKQMV